MTDRWRKSPRRLSDPPWLAVWAGHGKHIPGMSRTRQICGVRLSASGYSGVLGPGITEPGRTYPPRPSGSRARPHIKLAPIPPNAALARHLLSGQPGTGLQHGSLASFFAFEWCPAMGIGAMTRVYRVSVLPFGTGTLRPCTSGGHRWSEAGLCDP